MTLATKYYVEQLEMMFHSRIIDTESGLKYLEQIKKIVSYQYSLIAELENKLDEKYYLTVYLNEEVYQTPLGEVRIFAENMDLKTRLESFVENKIIKSLNFGLRDKFI